MCKRHFKCKNLSKKRKREPLITQELMAKRIEGKTFYKAILELVDPIIFTVVLIGWLYLRSAENNKYSLLMSKKEAVAK